MPEIEFAHQRGRQVIDNRGHVHDLLESRTVRRLLGEPPQQPEVLRYLGLRGGALHLDHHALAADQRGPVHLGDRPRRERIRLDAREHVLPRNLQLRLHHRHHFGFGQRRDMILKVSELRDDRRREQVRPGGQDLAELGEGRPEFLQRAAESPGPLGLIVLAPVHDVPQPVSGEDPGHVRRAAEELAVRWLGGRPGAVFRGVAPAPFSAVFTITTEHLALCETRLGTLPSRNSVRSRMPTLPTTTRSTRSCSQTRTMASAGSES